MATNKTLTGMNTEIDSTITSTPGSIDSAEHNTLLENIVESLWGTTITSIDDTDSPYTVDLDVTRILLCDDTNGSITVNLPAVADSTNRRLIVKKLSASNTTTIDPDGSETIEQSGGTFSTTLVLSGIGDSVDIIPSSAWYIVGSHSI